MVLTAYFALSPVTGLVCHRHRRDAKHHRQLDASVGASGPHDFAVRKNALSSAAQLASIASQPYVRDDRETPLCVGRDGKRYEVIWVRWEVEISDFPKKIAALVQRSSFATCRDVRRSVAIGVKAEVARTIRRD
jgi:hypothetical protein